MTGLDARLVARGRLPWERALTHLDGGTCLWADLDGLHTGPPPTEPPIATHLWAWDTDRLLRARVDGAECVLAELHLATTAAGEPVRVTRRQVPTWPLGEGRVSVPDEWRARSATLYEVAGLMPLTFARLDP
ncbi:hypothetical protein DPM19_01410 [Actinomadura craniellae]|uniref:Uncharacterized protein n=1 Tax=Actinomadura craniellae TaxID=2231787 RepID=A0A365HCW3_9ACTN|nr:hypothetical protein [Actinomadura craniellae]RAY16852.1 hypothetical protein DPM19_01410 [Actinomadura craniellae]